MRNAKHIWLFTDYRRDTLIQGLLLIGLYLGFGGQLLHGQDETQINSRFETAKLEILCRSLDFILLHTESSQTYVSLDCRSLLSLREGIPADNTQATYFFSLFEDKTYASYGKNKLRQRVDKLISDIEVELKKLKSGSEWREGVQVLLLELKNMKNRLLEASRPPSTETSPETETLFETGPPSNPSSSDISSTHMTILYTLIILLAGGLFYLYWQNRQLQQELLDYEDDLDQKYSRLDNRMDTSTPIKDYQSLVLKFNFLNDQLNAVIQEVQILKNRNQYKMSAEELFAQRTEHLETYTHNPSVQIYYAKPQANQNYLEPQALATEPSLDHIYKVEINLEDPDQAYLKIVDRREYHHKALKHPEEMLSHFCDYSHEPYNHTRILSIEPGLLEKKNQNWILLKKTRVTFE